MDTPKPVAQVTKGAVKAVSLQNVIFVAIVFAIVVMMIQYFTKQEIVTVNEDGETKQYVKSTLGFNKKKTA